jgi:hypothetical protein
MVHSDSPERTVYIPLEETVVAEAARVVSVLGSLAPLVGTTMRVPGPKRFGLHARIGGRDCRGGNPVDLGDAAEGLPSCHHVLDEGNALLRRQGA